MYGIFQREQRALLISYVILILVTIRFAGSKVEFGIDLPHIPRDVIDSRLEEVVSYILELGEAPNQAKLILQSRRRRTFGVTAHVMNERGVPSSSSPFHFSIHSQAYYLDFSAFCL